MAVLSATRLLLFLKPGLAAVQVALLDQGQFHLLFQRGFLLEKGPAPVPAGLPGIAGSPVQTPVSADKGGPWSEGRPLSLLFWLPYEHPRLSSWKFFSKDSSRDSKIYRRASTPTTSPRAIPPRITIMVTGSTLAPSGPTENQALLKGG